MVPQREDPGQATHSQRKQVPRTHMGLIMKGEAKAGSPVAEV